MSQQTMMFNRMNSWYDNLIKNPRTDAAIMRKLRDTSINLEQDVRLYFDIEEV